MGGQGDGGRGGAKMQYKQQQLLNLFIKSVKIDTLEINVDKVRLLQCCNHFISF